MVRAPTFAPVAQRQRQHAQTVRSASSNLARRTSCHALSSEAERRSHAPKVEISKFSARTSLRAKALRLGKPVVREGCRAGARRAKADDHGVFSSVAERGRDMAEAAGSFPARRTNWTSYRSGRTARNLSPLAQALRRFESCLVHQPSRRGASARQAGLRPRRLPRRSPTGEDGRGQLGSVTLLVRRLRCRRGERDSISLRSANSASLAQSAELSAHNGPGPGSSPGRCTILAPCGRDGRAPLEWPAIGLENRGVRKDRGSNPQLSASFGKRP